MIKSAAAAAARGDAETVRRDATQVARTLSEDTKAFAKALRTKIGRR